MNWFNKMENWKLTNLGDVANFVRGPFGGSLKKEFFVDEGYAVYEQQHAIRNQFHSVRYFIDENKFKEMKRFELHENDIIMSCSGTMGKVAIVPNNIQKGIINQALLKISPSNKLDSKFLENYMKSVTFLNYLNAEVKGVAIKNVASVKDLKQIPILLPPLTEQQAIVEKLDFAFDAIEKAKANIEKNIENAKELFQSKLNEIFSPKGEGNKKWVFKKLSDIFDVRDGTHDSPKYQESGFALVTSKNLKKGKITLDKIKFISEKDFININKRSNVSKGDILFAMIGTIGNPVVIMEEPDFAIKNVALIKSNKENNSYFFSYYLDLEMVIKKMQDESKGTTQRFVSLGYMRNFEVPCPKIEIQNKIVKQIDQLSEQTDLLQEKYKQKLANLEELKKSILEKAFKGELV